jgi:signal transduction histidine kinase
MQERTFHLGGDVLISGEPGKGTVVKVTIPLRRKGKTI